MIDASERINIRDLVVEEPIKTDYRFDPVEKLGEDDINKILGLVNRQVELFWNSSTTHLIWKARLLLPDRFSSIDEDSLFEKVFSPSSQIASVNQRIDFFADFKLLSQQNFKAPEPALVGIRDVIRALTSREEISYLTLDELAAHKLTFPNSDLPTALPEDVLFSRCLATAKDFRNSFTKPYKSTVRCFANMRILFPNRYSEFGLDETFWKVANGEIQYLQSHEKYQEGSVDKLSDLIVMAYDLKILAADKVHLSDSGLEFVMPEKATTKGMEPSMPEARKF